MITDAHLLSIRRFIATKAQTAAPTFQVFASGIDFTGKESFWSNAGADLTTQKAIETTLINGIWVEFLNFTDESTNPNNDNAAEEDSPVITRIYQLTIFCENNDTRYVDMNEAVEADVASNRFLSVDRLIELTINALVTEFRGISLIEALENDFVIRESNSLYMNEFVERDAECDFIPKKFGRQAKLVVPILLQLKQC